MIRSSKSAPASFPRIDLTLAASSAAFASATGITDTEIKFGNMMPYIGPASALSVTGKVFAAYFDMVNEKGGVNGRKLNMISLDDGFSPPKTVEATQRLVENDNVAFMFGTMGTAPSSATANIQRRQGAASVPDLRQPRNGTSLPPTLADGAALGAELRREAASRCVMRAQKPQCALCDPVPE